MIRYVTSIAILFSLFQQPLAASEVSLLQAFHVAEIHTTKSPSGHHTGSLNGHPHYVIEVPVDNEIKRVWVHRINGRVSKIESGDEQTPMLEYQWPGIRVVAHRGGVGLDVPENTLPAIQKAIDVGAHLVEIDIRQTKDGHLILMHDATVDRTTNGSGRVEDMTLDEIKALDAGGWHSDRHKGVEVPTLEEALTLMKGKISPDLDVKNADVEKLVAIINKVGIAGESFYHGSIEDSRKLNNLAPEIFLRPSVRNSVDIHQTIRSLWPPLINLNWHAVTEENIRLIHLLGAQAFVNTLETADTLLNVELAAEAGADYIQTDYPDRVIALLREKGLLYDAAKDIGGRIHPLGNEALRYPLR
ncbi:glycerophosphodiester phosphodiesterase [Pseudohongiella spirulinae]|uniref:GP-PDE domain-containing protein n=1 Tax=Pseudohongiella spirulinae TaxID=1249552 RepID=A0A0S2KGD2_9GAMM|nr:glycerophosphodiester phosphodiesterase family protein [Pseudohongiella spirulinae]ALO47392.1 hypothetical protein PS2015_2760 [Pseudohongiella spirulinae]